MKICFFGSYVKDSFGIPSGNGGTLLKKILETQNIKVIECHEQIKNSADFVPAYFKLFVKHRKLDYDVMIIPWRGILTLPLAKIIHKKPIIYFPAFSIYDTLVNDRKKIKKNSFKAKFVHFVDKLSCKWSDIVIVESSEEITYFVNEFGFEKEKFRQYHLAADESIFHPTSLENKFSEKFVVLFFGSFIPLHGVETIVKSAILLKENNDIIFKLCGDGQTKSIIEKIIKQNNLKNVLLLGLVSKEKLIDNVMKSSICLGIFGDTKKSRKVLTNKVYQTLASKKPLITMNSYTSIEAHLVDKNNCMLVPPGNPEKLADAILFLKNYPEKRKEIAEKGYQTYVNYLSMEVVGKRLVKILQELM